MEFPRKSQSCKCSKNLSTRRTNCEICSAANQKVCPICRNKALPDSLSNDVHVRGNLPDNICQCFFSASNIPDGVTSEREQQAQLAVPTSESETVKLQEKSCIKESSDISKDHVNSSDENSTTLELSHSSNGYVSSLDELSSEQSSIKKSPQSSVKCSKNIRNREKVYSSSGYALSLGEQSFDQNLTYHRNSTSPSSGDESKKSPKKRKEEIDVQSPVESVISTNSEHKGGSDGYKGSESSPSEQEHKKDDQSSNSESVINNKSTQYEISNSTQLSRFSIIRKLNTGYSNIRPQLPRPFPQYQPYINPVMPVPRHSQPHAQNYPYTYAEVNVPVVVTNISERFQAVPRPQASSSYQQNPNTEREGLSKKLLAQTQKVDSEENLIKKKERIENWLHEVECVPPEEEPSDSNWASGWSTAENEENEGIPPFFSSVSTDERSSTEISEEENRRQRALRRPPRNRKNRPN